MTNQLLRLVRRGKAIYSVDQFEEEELIATSPTTVHASKFANAVAGWHKVSLTEYEADEKVTSAIE